jgi:predicted nucleic acid-binding protein
MIIADTSVWIDHLRQTDEALFALLDASEVLGHQFITAELALGTVVERAETIALLEALPQASVASQRELMLLIERERLASSGIGFVDAHLLASCRLSDALLWTRDRRLAAQAQLLGCAWAP